MTFRRKGDKAQYSFLDAKCIGRKCWAPGMYQHRSPLSCGGSRNTGSPDSPCCLNRAYHGCPQGPEGERSEPCPKCDGERTIMTSPPGAVHADDLAEYEPCNVCHGSGSITRVGVPEFSATLAKERKALGWKR